MRRFLSQAMVIARRDFTAIVLTPTFLIFLLAPLFMLSVGAIGGAGAAGLVQGARAPVIILAEPRVIGRLRDVDKKLRSVVGAEPGPPPVVHRNATGDLSGQARAIVTSGSAAAVLTASPVESRIYRSASGARDGAYLAMLASAAASTVQPVTETIAADKPFPGGSERTATAFGAVFVMFFLTLLLASQAISMLAEERANKVIEILAAAVPLEAVFLGKLIGMLGVALLFTGFWGLVAAEALAWSSSFIDLRAIAPAIGMPAFVALFAGYFVLAFLLLGAVFLGVGAQASTMREIQMLSLPITIFQVSMFALASAGASSPDSMIGLAAAIFPFSSPFAMAARAASGVPAWQHAAAFGWQALWLALTVTVAARLFRRGVLSSSAPR